MELDVEFPLDFQASIPVAKGFAVCVCDTYIIITEVQSHGVAVYNTTTLELVFRFGTKGSDRGQFAFNCFYSGLCPRPRAFPGVFIADGGNSRVSEHLIPSGICVRLLGLTHLHHPRGVDANDTHIAVSDVSDAYSRVLLFSCNAVDDVPPLWVFGSTRGWSMRQLNSPYGLRLSRDGSAVYVVDRLNHRIIKIQVNNACSDAVVLVSKEHRLEYPTDAIEYDDSSLLIAESCSSRLTKVARDGTVTRFRRLGRGDGEFSWPSGLAICPVNGVLIVGDDERLHLFNVVSECFALFRLHFIHSVLTPVVNDVRETEMDAPQS